MARRTALRLGLLPIGITLIALPQIVHTQPPDKAPGVAIAPAEGWPRPVLQFQRVEQYRAGDKDWVRFRLEVVNRADFAPALFAAAPTLPPCGTNRNSSRTWVDIFQQDGRRLYGFCALAAPQDLGSLWFAVEAGQEPPRWVFVELHDRQTKQKQRSNLALLP